MLHAKPKVSPPLGIQKPLSSQSIQSVAASAPSLPERWAERSTVLTIFGVALLANATFFEAFIAPSLTAQAPELFESYPAGSGWKGLLVGTLAAKALFGVGFLLFGFALFRAESVPCWAIVLAMLGGIPFAVDFLLPQLVAILAAIAFATRLVGLGYVIWKDSGLLAVTPAV